MTGSLESASQSSTKVSAKKIGNDFTLIKRKIGTGSFASVYRGFRNKDRMLVAIKAIDVTKLNDKLLAALKFEIDVLKKFNHDNIVKLYFDYVRILWMPSLYMWCA